MDTSSAPSPIPPFLPPGSFARFSTLDWDRAAYADVTEEGRRRKIIRVISRAPTSPIQVRHNFQIGTIDSSRGNGPTLHAHDYPEIFIPVRTGYTVTYGRHGQHAARLGVYDAFSLPLNVLRKFEAMDEAPAESQMLSIFDTALDDARHGITISPEVAAADAAAGYPQDFQVSEDTLDIDPQEVDAKYIARYADLAVEVEDGIRIRRLVAAGDPRAALRTPHSIELDYLEVGPGDSGVPYRAGSREVFIALEGSPQVLWNDRPVAMERMDMLSVAPEVLRTVAAEGSARSLLLRIRDKTNPR
jgi:hypothetical protein